MLWPLIGFMLAAGIKLNDLNFGKVSYDPHRSYKVRPYPYTLS